MDHLRWIDQNRDALIQAADEVWGYAETMYQETQSAALLSGMLEEYGFKLTRGVAEIPTAFVAEYGSGGPIIGILGEYDALPGLSQDRVPYWKPLTPGGNGHGCGHNLFGVACLAAATAVKQAIESGSVNGTIRFYGCPAEEGGAGKTFMARAGLFDDADVCLTWHPGQTNSVMGANVLEMMRANFKFYGETVHVTTDAYNGRSALDAVELMSAGVNCLRKHLIHEAHMHYLITSGGPLANVTPDYAVAQYRVRSPLNSQVLELFARVKDIAQGAALMTGARLEIELLAATSHLLTNDTILGVLQQKLEEVGAPQYDAEEIAFARAIAATFSNGADDDRSKRAGPDRHAALVALGDTPLANNVMPFYKSKDVRPVSTDVGDVSWVSPTGWFTAVCHALGTPWHTWQIVAQGGMSIGHKGMLYAGKVLGAAALEFLRKPELVAQARAEFKAQTVETPYVCPIPADVKPPLNA